MDSEEEINKVKITCPHCHEEFTLEDMKEVDCSDCGTTTLSILTRKCKDPNCENVYCKDCLNNLNEHGYCDDCQNVCCDGCNSDVDRGTEVLCPKCKKAEFCTDCAPKMVGEEGCTECVDEELKIDCDDCGTILKSKAILCKNFAECGKAYCKEHSSEYLNENGYCNDCATLSCDRCGEDIDRGKHVHCTKCDNADFCQNCAKDSIDSEEGCIECVDDELKVDCADCSTTMLKSKAVLCKNFAECGNAYCKEHSADNIKQNGYCEDCSSFKCSYCGNHFPVEEATKCANNKCGQDAIFCKQCLKLATDSAGLCTSCSIKGTVRCVNCDRTVFTEQATKCENCDDYVCHNCDHKLTECSKCHKKVCPDCIKRCSECRKSICITCGDLDKYGRCSDHKTEEKKAPENKFPFYEDLKNQFEGETKKTEVRKDTTVFKSKTELREAEKKNETKPKKEKKGLWAFIKENFL